jgi:carbon storage regulator
VLVITRKLHESIVIGDGVEVKVLRVGRDGVRLGVTAAPNVPVHRGEVYDAIRRANAGAASAPAALGDLIARLRGHDSEA